MTRHRSANSPFTWRSNAAREKSHPCINTTAGPCGLPHSLKAICVPSMLDVRPVLNMHGSIFDSARVRCTSPLATGWTLAIVRM
jgi:hypothetical protein